jgi:hypothetical protein
MAYLVDGHHRAFIAQASGNKKVLSWILKPAQWEPFRFWMVFVPLNDQQAINAAVGAGGKIVAPRNKHRINTGKQL